MRERRVISDKKLSCHAYQILAEIKIDIIYPTLRCLNWSWRPEHSSGHGAWNQKYSMHVPISDQEGDLLWFAWGLVGGPPPLHNAGFAVLGPVARGQSKKGVPSAVGFPHCAGSGEGLSLSPKPYPHKCVEAGARTRDLPVTDGRLYRCTRPALHVKHFYNIHFY